MSTVDDDLGLWMAWKRVNEVIRARVLADVVAAGSVSEAEFTVLVYLDEAGGELRQNALAEAAGWDRTRLSHLLTRMEQRDLVERERLRNGVTVRLRRDGLAALTSSRGPLADAVERHFTSRLDRAQREALVSITAALSTSS